MNDVENYIKDILKERKIHFTLIDPDEQTPKEALEIATAAIEGGTDGIMIGGSTVEGDDVEETCKILSDNIAVPIILFRALAFIISWSWAFTMTSPLFLGRIPIPRCFRIL